MAKKRGNFIEEHIEKVVLLIAVLLSAFIFFKYILLNPNEISYNGREFRPGQIDIYIGESADKLKIRLNGEPVSREDYKSQSEKFVSRMRCPVENINTSFVWPLPEAVEKSIEKKYRIPVVGQVSEVSAEHIRAAAYVPKVVITQENVNSEESYEPNDIDFVTVQGSFEIGSLFDSFQECFAGRALPEKWRDENLAKPVFAAVQLQRQRKDSEGQWGEWEDVGPIKINPHRDEFKVIEEAGALSGGGIMVRLLRFGEPRVQLDILQPEPYQIASAEEEWFPPVLHKKYLLNKREKEMRERREAIAAERDERNEERDRSRQDRRTTRPAVRSPSGGGGYPGDSQSGDPRRGGGGGYPATRSTTRATRTERDRRQTDVLPTEQPGKSVKPDNEALLYEEFNKMLLTGKDISTLREPIVFWAHDDTVEPGNSYKYRVRIGVLNPVAGKNEVADEYSAYNSKVILWSEYCDVSEPVMIPERLYFFPLNVQETAEAVDVQVCKYALGYWYSEKFVVKRGEVIGNTAEVKPPEQKEEQDENLILPKKIDYTTGAVIVDVVTVNDWQSVGKVLQARHYFDMLYSYDGEIIARIAAKLMYWPEILRASYTEIRALEKRPRLPFRSFSSSGVFTNRRVSPFMQRGPMERGGEGPRSTDQMMDPYMMMRQRQ